MYIIYFCLLLLLFAALAYICIGCYYYYNKKYLIKNVKKIKNMFADGMVVL